MAHHFDHGDERINEACDVLRFGRSIHARQDRRRIRDCGYSGEHIGRPQLAQRPGNQVDHDLGQRRDRRRCGAADGADSTAIGSSPNANAKPYQLAITDSLPNIVGDLSALNGNSHVASLEATSGAATLNSGATIAAPTFTLTGSSTELTLAEILSYSGATQRRRRRDRQHFERRFARRSTGTDAFSSATISGAGTLASPTERRRSRNERSVISARTLRTTGRSSCPPGRSSSRGAVTGKGTARDLRRLDGSGVPARGVSTATRRSATEYRLHPAAGPFDLLAPTSFYGEISGFGTGDTVELRGSCGVFQNLGGRGRDHADPRERLDQTRLRVQRQPMRRATSASPPGTTTTIEFASVRLSGFDPR